MPLLDQITVDKIAHLSRLALTDEEREKYGHELGKILDAIAIMNSVNTENIEPMAHAMDLSQPLRDDIITEMNQRAKFQAIAPQTEAGLYIVPKVIE